MNLTRTLCTLVAMAALALPALAADEHSDTGAHAGHDDKARHGGVVRVVKDINYELILKPDTVALYVTDHGKPVDLKGVTARLTLLSSTDKSEVTLTPAGDRLEVKGAFKPTPGTKALAHVTLPGQAVTSVRFTLK
jgi:hypothetical protein